MAVTRRERERERERESVCEGRNSFSPRLLSFTPRLDERHARRSNEPASLLNATQVVSRPREKQVRGGQIDSRMTTSRPPPSSPLLYYLEIVRRIYVAFRETNSIDVNKFEGDYFEIFDKFSHFSFVDDHFRRKIILPDASI